MSELSELAKQMTGSVLLANIEGAAHEEMAHRLDELLAPLRAERDELQAVVKQACGLLGGENSSGLMSLIGDIVAKRDELLEERGGFNWSNYKVMQLERDELREQVRLINLRRDETISSLCKERDEMQDELESKSKIIENCIEETEKENKNIHKLSTELDQANAKIKTLTDDSFFASRWKNACEDFKKLRVERNELRDSDKVLRQRLKECREDLAVVDKDRGDLLDNNVAEVVKLLKWNTELRTEVALRQEACAKLKDEVEQLQKSIDFNDHLRKASQIVDKWPDWKKSVLIFPDIDPYSEEVETALLEFRSKDQTEIERLKGAVKIHKEVCDDALAEVAVLKECISDHECGNKLLNDMIVTLAQHNDELEEEEEETQELREYHDVVVSILAPLLEGVDKVRFSIKSVIRSQELALDQKMEALDKRDDALAEVQKQQDFIEYLLGDVDSSEAWEEFNASEENE